MDVLSSFGDLTQLYTEAKKSALSSVTRSEAEDTEVLSDLHRKFRIQKDRLIAWGLEWSDEGKGENGNIDASVARAGLTDIVSSVLNSIKDTLEAAERIRSASLPNPAHQVWPAATVTIPEKPRWLAVDQSKYRDLVTDLTASIDTLYDLSRARRAIAEGSHPSFSTSDNHPQPTQASKLADSGSIRSFASSTTTLVNPNFSRPALSPYVGLPPAIAQSALILPEEGPPPYESVGAPSTLRMIARLLLSQMPHGLRTCSQTSVEDPLVLVEFANYDMLYHETRVPPPLLRLEAIFGFSQRSQQTSTHLRMLGYFEDSQSPRIGIVYELPANQAQTLGPSLDFEITSPKSLLLLLQDASKSTKTVENVTSTPPLEVRFRLALRITERLREMHLADIAHGNMNSGSVVFMASNPKSRSPSAQVEAPLLDSFDLFSGTTLESSARPKPLNIYQHPQAQVEKRSSNQAMLHDIYGLALTLLEIGLWAPLGDLYKAKYTLQDLKTRLEKIWIPKLASKCGSVYMRAVQKCIAFADGHGPGPQIDLLYSEITRYLDRCCAIGEDDTVNDAIKSFEGSTAVSAPVHSQRPLPVTHASDPQTPYTRTASDHSQLTSFASLPGAPLHRLASLPNMTASVPSTFVHVPARKALPMRTPSQQSLAQAHVTDLHRMDTIKEGLTSAASSMRQAWDSRREQSTLSFREIRRKVVLLQNDGEENPPKNPYYQKRPVCGASIGAYLPEQGHMLPVSFGGIVQVDDKPYGLTVHHMLEPLSDDEDEDEESAVSGASDDESEDESQCGYTTNETIAKVGRVSCQDHIESRSIPSSKPRTKVPEESDDDSSSDLDAFEGNDEGYLSSDFESDLSDDEFAADSTASNDSTTGDRPGYPVESTRTVQITQPALIDAVSTGWHLTNIDQTSQDSDHLLSFALGKVYASSGLRRARHNNLVHEIDWALIELEPPRLQPHNLVLGGRRHCTMKPSFCPPLESPVLRSPTGVGHATERDFELDGALVASPHTWADTSANTSDDHSADLWADQSAETPLGTSKDTYPIEQDLYPCSILPTASLPNTSVLSFGRTSGLSTGRISAAMSFVKIAGRTTFSHSWSVVGEFGVGGDSGAWVVDAEEGRVAGHVLAEQRGVTYFCPMEVLVDDIRSTLTAGRVRLPGDEALEAVTEGAVSDADDDEILLGHQKADSVVSTLRHTQRTRRQKAKPVKAAVQSRVSECRLSSRFAVV
ncbi:hypothetical protein MBLNU457_1396t2 [Dothideomycetes sp. NU457]